MQAATGSGLVGGLGLEGGRQPGLAVVPAACSAGRTFVAGEFKLGYSRCCSLNIIFIFQAHFFWHLFPSLEVAELQEGRVKRGTALTCHLSAAPALPEEFALSCA